MDPGQDLLLAALSESGICPNDIGLFDVDAQDVAHPSATQEVRWSSVIVAEVEEKKRSFFFFLECSEFCFFSSLSPSVPWMLV